MKLVFVYESDSFDDGREEDAWYPAQTRNVPFSWPSNGKIAVSGYEYLARLMKRFE